MTSDNITETFKAIYARREWGVGSGPGSTPEFCAPLCAFLAQYVKSKQIKSLVDLGCGDLQWMPTLVLQTGVNYVGFDCVPELLSKHREKYTAPQFEFRLAELTPELCDKLPDADLYFCKDVLQHWPNASISAFLTAFFAARPTARLLIVNDSGQRSSARSSILGPTEPLDTDQPPLNAYCPNEVFAWGGKSVLELHQPYSMCRPVTDADYSQMLNEYVARDFSYPVDRFAGRGIVICAGGPRYFTNAYVALRVLRMHGCNLPAQFWHLGPGEITDEMRDIVKPLGVECVDGYAVRKKYPVRTLNGWELKIFSLLHCPFEEVLFLDADNVAVRNPEYLFDTPQYKETGAIFWPDYGRLGADRSIWRIVGAPYRDEPEFESGQIVINKQKSWKALNVAMHFNEWSDFYYRHIHGDKETFHMAWRKLGQPYSMPSRGIHTLTGTMCQHDFDGERVFQHRNMRKWQLNGQNERISDFQFEEACLGFIADLQMVWSLADKNATSPRFQELARKIVAHRYYQYCRVGYDFRVIELLEGGRIDAGHGAVENTWTLGGTDNAPRLLIWQGGDILADLSLGGQDMFHGHWVKHEKMPVVLLPSDRATLTAKEQLALYKPRLRSIFRALPAARSNAVVLTGHSGDLFDQMAEITVPKIKAYAHKYGRDFAIYDVTGERPASWYKVIALYQALQEYDSALWVDTDVVVMRDDKDIFAEIDQNAWQAMVEHNTDIGAVPNCGVWLVTKAMLPILEEIWVSGKYSHHGWWEQAAIMEQMGYSPDVNQPRKVRDSNLTDNTTFLNVTWNHHPRDLKNVEHPHFRHITYYPDRLSEMKRVIGLLPQ